MTVQHGPARLHCGADGADVLYSMDMHGVGAHASDEPLHLIAARRNIAKPNAVQFGDSMLALEQFLFSRRVSDVHLMGIVFEQGNEGQQVGFRTTDLSEMVIEMENLQACLGMVPWHCGRR
jgi:hypothetical protein